jgi:gamma-glutamyltranspeptidase/glutathione hydrolase
MNFDPNYVPYPSIRYPVYAREGLVATFSLQTSSFGRGQCIVRLDNGVLVGATEGRTDGSIACV